MFLFADRCSESDGKVVSVNNYGERSVLAGELALEALPTSEAILTSGVRLGEDTWTWFGAGENITDSDLLSQLPAETSKNTQCLLLSWVINNDNSTEVFYSTQDCLTPASSILCEVRVYTQTWYYWATANWLQILFCLTLVLLILSTCVTVSVTTVTTVSSHTTDKVVKKLSHLMPESENKFIDI